ncbi:MAG: NAD(P)-dependent oxidoreductase [Bacteroidetes bacterium]|nr:MAG: NAD(P)-dependent oxidoreductase [Bacteroidota bacterium]
MVKMSLRGEKRRSKRKAKSVLITGASGFIGSHLVEEGLKRGYEVWAAVRRTSSRQYLTDPRIRIAELDLADPEHLSEQFQHDATGDFRFDFVVHNTGITRARNAEEFYRINEGLTRNLVTSLEVTGFIPDKFLFISSLAAIGPGDPVLMQPITDDTPPNPVDPYGKSKLAAEHFLESRPGFPFLIVRPTGVYGPRERDYLQVYRTISRGFELYAGTSSQRISFIYIGDLVRIVFDALESAFTGSTWVVSDGRNYSAREFSALVKQILGKRTVSVVVPAGVVKGLAAALQSVARPFGQVPLLNRDKARILTSRNWQCDPSGIFGDLHFTPAYDLEQGLKETIRWCREQGQI